MPWVIAIMVSLTVIAAAAGLALHNAALATAAELEGGITVQIVEAGEQERETQVQAVLERLRAMPDMIAVRRVPDAEVDALIEPWLGSGSKATDTMEIPVPALIDARVQSAVTAERLAAIQRDLESAAPAARVDAQSGWLEPVFEALQSLQWLAISLVVLLTGALTAAVLLAARNALGANRDTIEIVHLLGGTDAQIARVFQRSIGVDAAGGGIVGLLLAVVVILFLGRRFARLSASLIDNGALLWGDWLVLALIPLLAVLLAMITARLTVMHALRKML